MSSPFQMLSVFQASVRCIVPEIGGHIRWARPLVGRGGGSPRRGLSPSPTIPVPNATSRPLSTPFRTRFQYVFCLTGCWAPYVPPGGAISLILPSVILSRLQSSCVFTILPLGLFCPRVGLVGACRRRQLSRLSGSIRAVSYWEEKKLVPRVRFWSRRK